MQYVQWRDDIFGKEPESDPVLSNLLEESYNLTDETLLDYIDNALQDPEIHVLFSKEQIGIGLNIIYSNTCCDISYSYIQAKNEERKIKAINNLKYLYENFFEKYCRTTVGRIYDHRDGQIGYLCFMLWDIFVLYPENATRGMVNAAIAVMTEALNSQNESCIVSSLHGLGHWSIYTPVTSAVIDKWLRNPTTINNNVLKYAEQAQTDSIQ